MSAQLRTPRDAGPERRGLVHALAPIDRHHHSLQRPGSPEGFLEPGRGMGAGSHLLKGRMMKGSVSDRQTRAANRALLNERTKHSG
jgi:hypothetical protein